MSFLRVDWNEVVGVRKYWLDGLSRAFWLRIGIGLMKGEGGGWDVYMTREVLWRGEEMWARRGSAGRVVGGERRGERGRENRWGRRFMRGD